MRLGPRQRFSDEPQCGTPIRPHPEERACSVLLQSRTSMRASRRMRTATECALMLQDASQRSRVVEASVLASRCDAPQHEGGARCLLAERSAAFRDHRRRLWVPALPSLSRGSAGTTTGSVLSTNLRLRETMAGSVSLFPACYLQGMLQLQRVEPSVRGIPTMPWAVLAPRRAG